MQIIKPRKFNPERISWRVILLLLAFGIGLLVYFFWHSRAIRQAERWPTTDAVVTSSKDISTTNLVETDYGTEAVKQNNATFAFTYTVGGQQYVSRRFYLIGRPSAGFISMRYPPGHRFLAHYNPNTPAMAIVQPGSLANDGALLVAILCLGFAATFLIYNRYYT
jgi:hypothetical protein